MGRRTLSCGPSLAVIIGTDEGSDDRNCKVLLRTLVSR